MLVALSGGKDSIATLQLCVEQFERVEAFYMYHVAGLQSVERCVDTAARRVGVTVHKVPHPELSSLLKRNVLRPHSSEFAKIKQLKQADIEKALTERTGIAWFAYGERASDSFARRLYTRVNDGIREDWHRIYPVWDWLHGDVIAYLKQRRIPLPERFGASDSKVMSGFSLRSRPLHWMKHHAPDDYRRVLEVFPYAEAMVMRYELEEGKAAKAAADKLAVGESKPAKQRKPKRPKRSLRGKLGAGAADEVSEVRDASGAPLDAAERAV